MSTKQPTVAELVAKAIELSGKSEETVRAVILANKARSFSKIETLFGKKTKAASVKIRKAGAVHAAGPKGFKFGPVWVASVVAGAGVALKPANLPKLVDHATHLGVEVTPDLTQVEIASAIAKAI